MFMCGSFQTEVFNPVGHKGNKLKAEIKGTTEKTLSEKVKSSPRVMQMVPEGTEKHPKISA